jgi:hypothetical protein
MIDATADRTPATVIADYLRTSPYRRARALAVLSGMWGVRHRYRATQTVTGDAVGDAVRDLEAFEPDAVARALDDFMAETPTGLDDLKPGDVVRVEGVPCEVGENRGGILTLIIGKRVIA